ncbi:MAG TPA: hypothetical protein VFN13_07020, partial [Rudaea sp.]|nr:hypothetical protein [Rudaea sp.]
MKTLLGVFAVLMAACGTIAVAADGTWSSEGPYGGAVYRLYVNPATPSVLYASTRGGIFRSDDGGVSWVRKEAGLGGTASFAYAVAMDADAPATLWVVDSFGHFQRSTDGGDNWAPTGYNVPVDDTVAQIADVPGTTGKLFIATRLHGVLVSVDNGASFLPSNTGLPAGVPINNIAVDPNDPMRVIAGTFYSNTVDSLHPQSVYLSMDGGVTWNGTLAFPGPPATYQQVVDISFGAGTKVYASIGSLLFRSDDNGASWVGPLGTIHDVESVAADPANGDTVLIGGRYGVARSTDGGVTSTPLNTGLIVTGGMAATVTRITLHPNYPTTGQIWLGTTEAGIYFSASSGATWIDQNDGLAATEIRALAMFHDGSTHRMFAGYGDAFEPSPALFRGNNSGPGTPFSSWTPSNTNLDAYQIRSITIDPTTVGAGIGSTRMYATGRAD